MSFNQLNLISFLFATAVYYGYYMLPDGTYCMAPPPPGVDTASYYNRMPSGVITTLRSSEVGTNLATTAPPAETSTVALAAADPSHLTTSDVPAITSETW